MYINYTCNLVTNKFHTGRSKPVYTVTVSIVFTRAHTAWTPPGSKTVSL